MDPPDPHYRIHPIYTSRGRPIFGTSSHARFVASVNGYRVDFSEQPSPGNRIHHGFPEQHMHPLRNEESFHSNPTIPTFIYYPPPPAQPDPNRDFHSVPVLSGPFPISHIPGTYPLAGRFNDNPLVLGPFHLHNIPFIPGTVPIHHIPCIPGPENVPHCPVLFETDENDPNLSYPGYSILVPVPFGAIPAVEIYIFPSEFPDIPNHVLIFQHGYMLPPTSHFLYLNSRDIQNIPEPPPSPPVPEENGYPPVIGMRIGRQPSPACVRGGRARIYNPMIHNVGFGQNLSFGYTGPSFGSVRGMRRRPFARGFPRDNRARVDDRFRNIRPLHSCGSNDPAHNCLWDQKRKRPIQARPKPPVVKNEVVAPLARESLTPEEAPVVKPLRIQIQKITILKAPKEESTAAKEETSEATGPPDPDDSSTSEDEVPKKKEDPGEGTSSSTTKRKTRFRPTYDYLRNPKRDSSEKVKIRKYDENGKPVPTYRQAVHYCTKYHEKQSRKKLRTQRRTGQIDEVQLGERTLVDDWLGDCTTTDSDSDSSFLTDEGGDQTVPPNSKQMLAYYYEIKALKEEEKKKKKKK